MTNPDSKYLDKWKENFDELNTSPSVVYITVYDKDGKEFLTLSNKELISFSLTQDASYLVENLPSYEIKFEVDNTDGRFDIDNPSGLYEGLTEKNRVEVKLGYLLDGVEVLISGGTYYLSSWNISSNNLSASFTANDFLYFMTDKVEFNSLYDTDGQRTNFEINGGSGLSLYTILNDLLKDEGISYELDTRLNNISTTYTFPLTPKNELIGQLAVAGQCSIYIDRETNTLHIMHIELGELVDGDIDYTVDGFNQFSYPEITLESSLDKLEVEYTSHYNTSCDLDFDLDVGGSGVGYNGSLSGLLTGQPLRLTASYDLGYISLNNRDEWIKLSNSSTTIMSAAVYNKTQLRITFASVAGNAIIFLPREEITTYSVSASISGEGNAITMSNPFITDEDNANNALLWETNYFSSRRVVDCSYRADPRLDCLDFIGVDKKYGGVEGVLVEHIEYSYTGGMFRGSLTSRTLDEYLVSSFATDSWNLIAVRSERGEAEKYYNVGDTKTITIDGIPTLLRIIGFNHDDLVGGGKAGMTIETARIAIIKGFNSNSHACGWDESPLRENLNSENFLNNYLPNDLTPHIKSVYKKAVGGYGTEVITTSEDKIFPLALCEIYSASNFSSYIFPQEGSQYEFYKNSIGDGSQNNSYKELYKEGTDGYWLRSSSYNETFLGAEVVCAIANESEQGFLFFNTPNTSMGVSFAFCI